MTFLMKFKNVAGQKVLVKAHLWTSFISDIFEKNPSALMTETGPTAPGGITDEISIRHF